MIDLIYCGNRNNILDKIAKNTGFKYGLRLPNPRTMPDNLYFVDQDWKNPNKEIYLKYIYKYRPKIATVLDIEHRNQLIEAMSWAEEISFLVDVIIFIPKCTGIINKLPKQINGKTIRLGYSVPSNYGKTKLNLKLFSGWEIHLLGGSPERQIQTAQHLNVVSMDCNYHSMKANRFGEFWTGKFDGETRWWRKLSDKDLTYKQRSLQAFELSCKNIYKYWNNL